MDYFEMYKDIWAFHKKFIDGICESTEYWQMVVDESEELLKKYCGCGFMKNLLSNELNELDRLYKEMKSSADKGV